MNNEQIKERIKKYISKIDGLKSKEVYGREFKKWRMDTSIFIKRIFGDDNDYVLAFEEVRYLSPFIGETTHEDFVQFIKGLDEASDILQSLIEFVDDSKLYGSKSNIHSGEERNDSKKIFIIHGHDSGTKETVARFLKQIDIEPIILHEQANEGKTIIEKFEKHADVGFAIALLTPDDEGFIAGKQNEKKFRARQNVIYELGYFAGKLGRQRVMALKKGEIEIPSDILGVLYENIDEGGAWKMRLVKELKTAGFDVDANKAF